MRRLTGPGLGALLVLLAWAAPLPAVPLRAGASTVPLDLPPGTPVAGYGGFPRRAWLPGATGTHAPAFWFRPSTGTRDPLRVRALALEAGESRILWLAADLVGIDPRLVVELGQRLARRAPPLAAIILSASHTHSGPGGFAESEFFGLVALDRPSPAVRRRLLDALELAARRAEAGKKPVLVGTGSVELRGLNPSRIGAAVDEELTVVKLVSLSGRPVALLWNFAIHGTALGKENFELSGDLMGDASARLESSLGAPALFVNGAVADASPAMRGSRGVGALGTALASAALDAWRAIVPGPADRLAVARRAVPLPAPRLSMRRCAAAWIPRGLAIGLEPALPVSTELVAVDIGGRIGAVTVPGELQMALGRELKAAARAHFPTVVVAGLSNDYLGYFLSAERAAGSGYMACASLYGKRGGQLILRAATDLLYQLGRRRGEIAGGRPGERERGPAATEARPASAPVPTSSGLPCCGGRRPW